MMKKMIIALLAVVVAIAAALLVAGCGSLPKSAVAEVNGKVITKEDLDNKIQDLQTQYGSQGGLPQPGTPEYADFQKQVAEELVTEEVMWFEADKMGIQVTDDDVNKQIDQIKQSVGGDKQFQQALSQRNMTLDRLKDNVRKGLIYQKLFDQVTKNQGQVSDQQAQDYYNQHKSDGTFQQPEQRQVRHILVADQATAQKVEAQLKSGADFAALAKQYSTDTASKDKGGELGTHRSQNSRFVPEFEQAMDKLAAGQISDPVKTQFGWHIIQVEKIIPAGTQSFDQAKSQIKQQLLQDNQQQVFMSWLNKTKANYDIKYADEFNPAITTPVTGGTGTAALPGTSTAPAAAGSAPAASSAPAAGAAPAQQPAAPAQQPQAPPQP